MDKCLVEGNLRKLLHGEMSLAIFFSYILNDIKTLEKSAILNVLHILTEDLVERQIGKL